MSEAVQSALMLAQASPGVTPARDGPTNRLAILIAATWQDRPGSLSQSSMHHDIDAMVPVLRRRGFREDEILGHDRGPISREAVCELLRSAGRRIASWSEGEVFVYVTGNGSYSGQTATEARLAVQLEEIPLAEQPTQETAVFWDEIVSMLAPPAGVSLTILPDT